MLAKTRQCTHLVIFGFCAFSGTRFEKRCSFGSGGCISTSRIGVVKNFFLHFKRLLEKLATLAGYY